MGWNQTITDYRCFSRSTGRDPGRGDMGCGLASVSGHGRQHVGGHAAVHFPAAAPVEELVDDVVRHPDHLAADGAGDVAGEMGGGREGAGTGRGLG